jgi:hypothetical protein
VLSIKRLTIDPQRLVDRANHSILNCAFPTSINPSSVDGISPESPNRHPGLKMGLMTVDSLDNCSLSFIIYLLGNPRGTEVAVLRAQLLTQPVEELEDSEVPGARAEQAFDGVNAFDDP